jgi:Tfp pilus assembly protein PilF
VGEATARLEEAEAKGALRPAARVLLGRLQVERGETAKARAIFEEVLRSKADLPIVKSDLAYLLAVEGADLERANELARDAQAALPDDPEVLDTMGYVELRRGNPAVALVHLQRATTLAEEAGAPRAVHFYHLGLAQRAARQNRSAAESFDRALALEPGFSEAARAREERAQALAGGAPTSSPPRP